MGIITNTSQKLPFIVFSFVFVNHMILLLLKRLFLLLIHIRLQDNHAPLPGPRQPSSTTGSKTTMLHYRVQDNHAPLPGPRQPCSTTGSKTTMFQIPGPRQPCTTTGSKTTYSTTGSKTAMLHYRVQDNHAPLPGPRQPCSKYRAKKLAIEQLVV